MPEVVNFGFLFDGGKLGDYAWDCGQRFGGGRALAAQRGVTFENQFRGCVVQDSRAKDLLLQRPSSPHEWAGDQEWRSYWQARLDS